jgi:hypothetical protein
MKNLSKACTDHVCSTTSERSSPYPASSTDTLTIDIVSDVSRASSDAGGRDPAGTANSREVTRPARWSARHDASRW